MRAICSGCFLLLALWFPLLLDGQAFSNNLIGIAFAAIAIALTIESARGRQELTATPITWARIASTLREAGLQIELGPEVKEVSLVLSMRDLW